VDLTNARNQYEIAQKHLDALMAVGKQQQLKSAAGQLDQPRANTWARRATELFGNPQPIDGVVADVRYTGRWPQQVRRC